MDITQPRDEKLWKLACLALLAACNSSGGGNNMADSLGARATDTTGRGDTMYYERMIQNTSPTDSASGSNTRKDTAYYERLPNKTNPPDSSD